LYYCYYVDHYSAIWCVFSDVVSLSEKTCPVCNGIMGDLSEEQMTAHVNSHYSQECPMCNKVFPQNYDEVAFREHVESHFSEDG